MGRERVEAGAARIALSPNFVMTRDRTTADFSMALGNFYCRG